MMIENRSKCRKVMGRKGREARGERSDDDDGPPVAVVQIDSSYQKPIGGIVVHV